jgi:hypothetical protein
MNVYKRLDNHFKHNPHFSWAKKNLCDQHLTAQANIRYAAKRRNPKNRKVETTQEETPSIRFCMYYELENQGTKALVCGRKLQRNPLHTEQLFLTTQDPNETLDQTSGIHQTFSNSQDLEKFLIEFLREESNLSNYANIASLLLAFHYHEPSHLKLEVIKEIILKAHQQGLPESFFGLGLLYREGLCGYERNEEKAQECFKKAANFGHFDARIHLALLLFSKNLNEEAYEWLQKDSDLEASLQALYEYSGELNVPPEENTKDINAVNHNGWGLLHFAAKEGKLEQFISIHPEANVQLKTTRCVCYVQDKEVLVVQTGSTPLDIVKTFRNKEPSSFSTDFKHPEEKSLKEEKKVTFFFSFVEIVS